MDCPVADQIVQPKHDPSSEIAGGHRIEVRFATGRGAGVDDCPRYQSSPAKKRSKFPYLSGNNDLGAKLHVHPFASPSLAA